MADHEIHVHGCHKACVCACVDVHKCYTIHIRYTVKYAERDRDMQQVKGKTKGEKLLIKVLQIYSNSLQGTGHNEGAVGTLYTSSIRMCNSTTHFIHSYASTL